MILVSRRDAYTAAAVLIKEGTSSKLNYIGRDYLGSITHVIDATTGVMIDELSYDAWGRFRDPKTHKMYSFEIEIYPVLGWRGYTGHEHLPMYGLINMNARLYDPVVGRFLSPDPYVQAPWMSQNFNRYSYALNNPLRYTDPSGEIIPFIIAGAIIGGAINLGYKALNGQINSWTDGFMAFGVGAAAGAVGAFTGGTAFIAAGGAAAGAGGIVAGVWGGVMGYIGSAPIENLGNHIYFGDPLMSAEDYTKGIAFSAVTGGVTNGVVAKINGKNVWTGIDIAEGRSAFAINNTPVKQKFVPSDIKNEVRLLDAPNANIPDASIGLKDVSPNVKEVLNSLEELKLAGGSVTPNSLKPN